MATVLFIHGFTANLDLIGKTPNNPAYPDAPPRC
jgi:hypothetical protein